MSAEHIWPAWMVELFPKGKYSAGIKVDYQRQEVLDKSWTMNDVTHKAKVVCKPCNNGWMSTIEDAARPILVPLIEKPLGKRPLNIYAQSVLANWAALHAMVFDRVRNPDSSYFSVEERQAFANSSKMRKPISHTHVWVALLPDMGGMGTRAGIHSRGSSDNEWRYSFFNCVFSRIIIQVFHWSGFTTNWIKSEDSGKAIDLRKLDDPIWQFATIKVWPRKSPLKWPPKQSLTHDGMNPFYNRFFIP